jgi:thioredoxin 1
MVLGLVALALLSGHFPGSDSPCTCGTGTAFAQAPAAATATGSAVPGAATAGAGEPALAPAVTNGAIIASSSEEKAVPGAVATPPAATGPLPKLVDLGAGKCIPCKKMAPILEEAKKLYEGLAEVVFIDVWEDRSAAEPYGVRTIPTQIFFDATGKEVFRHEGFFPMEDIQKQFESMGVALKKQ